MKITPYISAVIILALAIYGVWHYRQYEEIEAVNIQAPTNDLAGAIPVFAQFIITQSLTLDDAYQVTKLSFPAYYQSTDQVLQIELKRNEHLIQSWEVTPQTAHEITETTLDLDFVTLLDGDLTVTFSASQIDHEHQDQAPLLFIEGDDSYYPDGNYFIASNSKFGDVSLTLFAEHQLWEKELNYLISHPVSGWHRLFKLAAALILIIILPQALGYLISHKSTPPA